MAVWGMGGGSAGAPVPGRHTRRLRAGASITFYSLAALCFAVMAAYLYPYLFSPGARLPQVSPMALIAVVLTLAFLGAGLKMTYKGVRPGLVFAYNCFVKPVWKMVAGKKSRNEEHQDRLEEFYAGQAGVYDITRKRLLRGRTTMLKLCAAQLRQHYPVKGAGESPASLAEFIMRQRNAPVVQGGSRSPVVRAAEAAKPPAMNGDVGKAIQTPPASPRLPVTGNGISPSGPKKIVWLEIGGGTGENVEIMNEFYPVSNFDVVYMVDITPSLCEIAKQRFRRLGWDNVRVLCMDAAKFAIPKEDGGPEGVDVALVTMSYSLSMMENIYPVVDRLSDVLSSTGIVGVADFYSSPKRAPVHDPTRQLSWFSRWFWQMWFDADNVYLHPYRREYLEHKFATIKSLNAINKFIKPVVRIPYYVWIGARRDGVLDFHLDAPEGTPTRPAPARSMSDEEITLAQLEYTAATVAASGTEKVDVEGSGAVEMLVTNSGDFDTASIAADSPRLAATLYDDDEEGEDEVPHLDLGLVSANHVHGQGVKWRMPFDPSCIPSFSTYIYAFAWEDPREDLRVMELRPDDRMMVITSGGCNALEYVLEGVARVHCVDMNPCQNNMLELKLAGISALPYADFWKIFGEGYHPEFLHLLETQLSPYLSPHAFHFWHSNSSFHNLFKTGGSGLAIRIFEIACRIKRIEKDVRAMCETTSLEEQIRIWEERVRPTILSQFLIKILNNEKFHWMALGVPPKQMDMILNEGTVYDYIANTLDPIIRTSLLSNDNYFYYAGLMAKYSKKSCPTYLTEAGFQGLQAEGRLDSVRIHTDSMVNVLRTAIEDNELTRVVVMDHLDWFTDEMAHEEISALAPKVAQGGRVYWRSAGKVPWYNPIFEQYGFDVKPIRIREAGDMIDRVNMYASFWYGQKK
ncbi:hypothetical protein DFJ74DRAFT_687526 [Hyaloraphidium curvatum]|nr:hypothetical protein DFJ74DRAFT_687526 [Hyaloraphidium curvatum]